MAARQRRFGTVRVRTTVGAGVVVAVALVIGGVVLVGVLRQKLTDQIETTARLRADDVVALLEAGTTPSELAADEDDDASLVQIIDTNGHVVSATENVEGEDAIVRLAPGAARTISNVPTDSDDAYRVVAEAASTPSGPLVVVVGRNLESVDDTVAAVASLLAAGLPFLILLVVGTTWNVTGRALRPVEAIRSEVTAITASQLERRVPEPRGDDEVSRLARTMNEMLARLEASRGRQRRFVSDAGHELRNPLATIRHELEVLLANPGGADVVEVAHVLLDENLRMQALVEDLLVLAKSDEGSVVVNRRAVDLDDLVLAEAARLRSQGRVLVDVSGVSAGQVLGDPSQLARVVRNLVDNAGRHASSTVRLSLTQRGDRVTLAVADDGPGVPVGDRARIFERFTRLDDARSRGSGGYGLGLAIVAEVVAAHQGDVRVEAAPDGGARFIIDVPAAQT